MQTTFKLKLQNALNNANFTDADCPALIVGGRRRNRKKRRNRNGQNKRKGRKGDNFTDSPAETPESPRKTFINYSEPHPQKVSCLDIEEPVFESKMKERSEIKENENKIKASETDVIAHDKNADIDTLTESYLAIDKDVITETYEFENKRGLPRHHSDDSGVFDDEEGLVQENLLSEEDVDLALSKHAAVSSEQDFREGPDIQIEDQHVHETRRHEAQVTEQHIFEEVFLDNADEDDTEDIIFDLTDLKNKILEENDHISPEDEKFQLKSLMGPTELEDEIPEQLSLDLLTDDEDDVVLFDAGSPKEPGIICNPLYEQSLKEEQDAMSIRSYQVGFKPDFDTVNFIRLPATDKAAKKEMKESSPLITKQSGDELPCCVIL